MHERGYVTGKTWLGLTMTTVFEAATRYYDDMVEGVYVSAVEPGSRAEQAGVQAGDIITAIDDTAVLTEADLIHAANQYRPGESAALTICRGRSYLTVPITFDDPPSHTLPTPTALIESPIILEG